MTPYYADDLVTIYHGDCGEWMPEAEGQEELNLDGLAASPDPCPFPDCELAAEHPGGHHVVVIGTDLDGPDEEPEP